jgi:hypothetical protein
VHLPYNRESQNSPKKNWHRSGALRIFGQKRAGLGSSPLEPADSGGRAGMRSSIEIRADLGKKLKKILTQSKLGTPAAPFVRPALPCIMGRRDPARLTLL